MERYQPSLIITDLKMPKMDGIEMLRRLREEGNNAFVIILTAYDSFAYAQSALRLGAVDFLLKPFHDGELEQAVQTLRRRMEALEGGTGTSLPLYPGSKRGIRASTSSRLWTTSENTTPTPTLPWGKSPSISV